MNCHRCGTTLSANANVCPSCYRTPDKTRVLREVEADIHKTRLLVHVDRCANCGFLIFSGDTECQSCGTWVDRSWKKPTKKSTKKPKAAKVAKANKKQVAFGENRARWMFGVTAGVMTSIVIIIALFIIMKH